MLLPPNIEDIPPPGLALVEELDKLLLVQVGGGRSWRAPLLLPRIAAHRLLRSLWLLVSMPVPSRCSGSALPDCHPPPGCPPAAVERRAENHWHAAVV